MQDYIIFGHGYNGDVREDDDNLSFLRVISKPVLLRAGDPTPEGANLQFFELTVHVIEVGGKRYNLAADVIPCDEDLIIAVRNFAPTPISYRAG